MPLTGAQLAAGISGILTLTRASVAYDVDSAGVLQSYANDVPLIGYQNSLYGERLEAAATNQLLRSQELDDAAWTKASCTITANSTVAPDGTMTADTANDTSAANVGRCSQTITVPDDSGIWCTSIFILKTGAPTFFPAIALIYSGGTPPATIVVSLNTQTGAVLSTGAVAAGALDMGSYWRLWIAGANNGTGNTSLETRFTPARSATLSTTSANAPVGSQVVWGLQTESGYFPTSYVPTAAATASRAAANSVHTMAADLAAEFTCLAQARVAFAAASGFQPYLFEIQGPTSDERIYAQLDPATQKILVGAVSGAISLGSSVVGGAITPPAEVHCAIRVRANQIHASVGGGAPVLIASGRPVNLKTFARGMKSDATAANYWSSLIRKAQISPYEINDAALQALSA